MFGLFAPKCPIRLEQKVWIEQRMRWLADKLGRRRMLDAQVILPTEEYFPDPYQPTIECIRTLMNRIQGYMQVTADIQLEIVPELAMEGALGIYFEGSPPRIQISASIIHDPFAVTATLTHELAHEVLLGGGLIHSGESDHEQVTDLLMIFIGNGIFATNETVKSKSWKEGNLEFFSISKSGYLSAADFGYAMAIFAYHRRELNPEWARHLRPDAAEVLKKGLRFLEKTGDTLFHPDRPDEPLRPAAVAETIDWLNDGTPSRQLHALWELARAPMPNDDLLGVLANILRHREDSIAEAAAIAIAASGSAGGSVLLELRRALGHGSANVRAAAASALGFLQVAPEQIIHDLENLLSDVNISVAASAAESLARCGPVAKSTSRLMLRAIDAALFREKGEHAARRMILSLRAIEEDTEALVIQHFEDGNDEHRDFILECLELLNTVQKADEQSENTTDDQSSRSSLPN